ncbi:MAG: hypothetical protein RLZZ157_1839 [Pseudomonadota bacterium]|jgi:N-acyl-L-homoserine lactone synthetase
MEAHLITPRNRYLYLSEIEAMHRHRHEIFVDEMGWAALRSPDGIDIDQFDTQHSHYVIILDSNGQLVGSDRLNPTIHTYMLGSMFPHFAQAQIPIGPGIWEWSRHAPGHPAWPESLNRRVRLLSTVAILEFAMLNNITAYTGILESRVLPMAMRLGWQPRPLGTPVDYGEGEGVACNCPVDLSILPRLRRLAGVSEPLLKDRSQFGDTHFLDQHRAA